MGRLKRILVAWNSRMLSKKTTTGTCPIRRIWTSMTSLNRALQAAGGSGGQVDASLLARACSDHEEATSAARALGELSRE